ncbi:MAG: hypothetical protein IIB37_05505 [Gemmatimonadetes bacterium]|nr:hypothetical protein [Gemmatimonadota bacterium]
MLLEANWIVYGLLASIIASVHLWIGWFEVRFERSENRWIGFIGGIAVGYVTLYMLPKLSRVTVRFIAANPDAAWALQYRAYFILLLGIVVYLVFERVSRMSAGGANAARWLEIGVLGLYGFLIGYVAVELPRSEIRFHVLANVILALHLMGMVHRLRRHHPSAHAGWGRIGFALLVVFGYVLGVVTELHEFIIVDATAFTAGVILVNIMSEELPRGKEGHLRYFLMGVGVFAAVSILIPRT